VSTVENPQLYHPVFGTLLRMLRTQKGDDGCSKRTRCFLFTSAGTPKLCVSVLVSEWECVLWVRAAGRVCVCGPKKLLLRAFSIGCCFFPFSPGHQLALFWCVFNQIASICCRPNDEGGRFFGGGGGFMGSCEWEWATISRVACQVQTLFARFSTNYYNVCFCWVSVGWRVFEFPVQLSSLPSLWTFPKLSYFFPLCKLSLLHPPS